MFLTSGVGSCYCLLTLSLWTSITICLFFPFSNVKLLISVVLTFISCWNETSLFFFFFFPPWIWRLTIRKQYFLLILSYATHIHSVLFLSLVSTCNISASSSFTPNTNQKRTVFPLASSKPLVTPILILSAGWSSWGDAYRRNREWEGIALLLYSKIFVKWKN